MEHTMSSNDKKRNAEEMLQLCIYDYLMKQGHPESATLFAKKANIEITESSEQDLLEDWWAVFWPKYCSSVTSPGNLESSQQVKIFDGKEMEDMTDYRDEILQVYTYYYLIKQDSFLAARKFGQKVDITKISELANYKENFLEGWWAIFWARYNSKMTIQTGGGNPQAQSSRKPPLHPRSSQRRAGNHPMATDAATIRGPRNRGRGPLGFAPVNLQPAEVLHSCYSSNLQIAGTIQAPEFVAVDPSVQYQSTYEASPNMTYSPATPISGEYVQNNQRSLTGGGRVGEQDGPGPQSIRNRIPEAFFEMMQEEAEERRRNGRV